jgi:hypothetical protein
MADITSWLPPPPIQESTLEKRGIIVILSAAASFLVYNKLLVMEDSVYYDPWYHALPRPFMTMSVLMRPLPDKKRTVFLKN